MTRALSKLTTKLHLGRHQGHKDRAEEQVTSPVSSHDSVQDGMCQEKRDEAVREAQSPEVRYRDSLKMLMITWNMHDSVPHGDLTDLLGALPSQDVPLPRGEDDKSLPRLAPNDEHLYHLVVVCGQEAPGGARWTELLDDYFVKGITAPKRDIEQPSTTTRGDFTADAEASKAMHMPKAKDYADLERAMSPPLPNELAPALPGMVKADTLPNMTAHHASSDKTSPLIRQKSATTKPGRGPYVAVSKERLLGIYIIVFALRTVEHLITGHDKATVTAGLLGGRVGNKGCAAISLHIMNTRLLFISAHLAAQCVPTTASVGRLFIAHSQEGQNTRKENVLKIRDELYIDDFSGLQKTHADAHRKRDVSELFDCVFFAGDLNYRVDVSRLHADWLVRNQDWRSFLQFDQLRPLLQKAGTCWSEWHEGEIDFPPTYKYDLIKLDRRGTLERKVSLRHLPSGRRRKKAETISAAASGSSTPLPAAAESAIAASARSSTSSLHDVLANGELADRLSAEAPEIHKQLLHALQSESSTSLDVPMRHDSKSSDGDDEPLPSLSKASTERGTISSLVTQVLDKDATFDTSKKQRVQSWCDRILWRSNMAAAGSKSEELAPAADSGDIERVKTLPRRFSAGEHERRLASDSTLRPGKETSFAVSNGHANGRIPEEDSTPKTRPRSRSTASEEVKRKPFGGFGFIPTFALEPSKTVDVGDTRRGSVMSNWRQWLMGSSQSAAREEPPRPLPPVKVLGPRRGQIDVIQYTSVNDLRKMQMLSDHRPVRAVLLLGIGDEQSRCLQSN